MSFGDHVFAIPGSLTTAANSVPEEGTTSGTGKVEYVAPCDLDIQEFNLLVGVTLGNTITNATGWVLAKVDAAGTETVLERLVIANNSNGLFAGDGSSQSGGTVAAATTFAYPAGTIIRKHLSSFHFIAQGETIRMRGSTTVGSATGDLVPFVVARAVPGGNYKVTNVYNEGVLTRNA